jgi:acyl carrier protein
VKVYPAEVEQVLAAHQAVAEAAVYGVSDPVMGERVRAAVVLRDETSCTALIAWCRERLADFKVPAEIDVVAELPRGRTGKVLKRVLREQHQQLRRDPRALSSRELERRIAVWLGEKLSVDPARVDTRRPFTDHGLTSIAAVELAAALASWLGRDVPPLITWQFSTAASLARHLETSS